jgi:F0F1-type ATP synthase membrane subunit c/vacuolar-type H+-ATPase subunit K
MDNQRRASMSPHTSRAALLRDAALERVRRTRRWVLLATAGLTAGFAALVSAVAPGRSLASKTSASSVTASASAASASTASSSGSGIPSLPPPAGANQLGLSGPDGAPSPDQSQSSGQSPSSAPAQPQSAPAPAPAPVAPPVVSGGS